METTTTMLPRSATTDASISVDELRLPIEFREPAIVDARRRSLEALDGTVRRSMRPLAAGLFAVASAVTIYDAVYPSTPEVGGFWTVASRWMGLITHSITSYTVSLEFDGQNRPDRFIVSGAREVRTSDASPEALERAVDEVRRAGPLTNVAPHAFTGFAF